MLGLRLQPVAKQLVACLLPLTTAKRHRVRVAALQALRVTMHQVRGCLRAGLQGSGGAAERNAPSVAIDAVT